MRSRTARRDVASARNSLARALELEPESPEAIRTLDPKAEVAVDLATGTVRAETGAAPAAVTAAVEEEGYKVTSAA